MPPLDAQTAILPPPRLRASEAEVTRGRSFTRGPCAVCHGTRAIGGVKDLRHMDAGTHARFPDIVLHGAYLERGMASFDDLLDEGEVSGIHAYLVTRANEDWGRAAPSKRWLKSGSDSLPIMEGTLSTAAGSDRSNGRNSLDWGLLSHSIGPRVRLLRNVLVNRSLAASEPFGLPTGSLTIMALIAQNPGSSQVDLAQYAGMTGPSLVGMVDELERRGLVRRERSKEDRRRNMLVVTEKGGRTMTALFAVVHHIEDPIQQELSAEELEQFIAMLDRINAVMATKES